MMHIFKFKTGIIQILTRKFQFNNKGVHMDNNKAEPIDSLLKDITGFNIKAFLIIIAVAYLSILTIPMIISALNLPAMPVVLGIMSIQYFLLYYVGKIHGQSILKTMTSNGFVGWIMWFALVCMLMLPIIHLLSLFGVIPNATSAL